MKYLLISIVFLSNAFNVFAQSSNRPKIFESDIESVVIKSDTLNLDDCKSLILIPGGVQFEKYFDKINYFDNYLSYSRFEKEMKKSEYKEELKDLPWRSKEGLLNAYTKYKKFLCLYITIEKDNVIKLKLYRPDVGNLLIVEGKSKTISIGISAGSTYISDEMYYSLMNELVNYIRVNSKTYNK